MATPIKTTTNFKAYLQGTSFSGGDYADNPMTVTESWVIQPSPAIPPANPSQIKVDPENDWETMTQENIIPFYGMKYSDWVAGRSPAQSINTNLWWKYSYCTSIEMSKTKTGEVVASLGFASRWKARPSTMAASGTVATLHDTPVVEYAGAQRETETFRQNGGSSVAAPPAALDKSAADIAGDATNSGSKNGIITYVPQMKVRVKRVLDVEVHGGISNIMNYFAGWIGTRNSVLFLNLPVNSVVMEGMSASKLEGPYYEVLWDFLYDSYYEHSQVPELDRDNVPKMNATGTNYADVRWVRVSRSTQDHNGIFFTTTTYGTSNATVKGFAEKGYWN